MFVYGLQELVLITNHSVHLHEELIKVTGRKAESCCQHISMLSTKGFV